VFLSLFRLFPLAAAHAVSSFYVYDYGKNKHANSADSALCCVCVCVCVGRGGSQRKSLCQYCHFEDGLNKPPLKFIVAILASQYMRFSGVPMDCAGCAMYEG